MSRQHRDDGRRGEFRERGRTSTVVNSKICKIADPAGSLLAFLRYELGLTGVKPGCGEGACGACTVLVDGQPMLACQRRAGEVAGR